jgi:hypothetical protein
MLRCHFALITTDQAAQHPFVDHGFNGMTLPELLPRERKFAFSTSNPLQTPRELPNPCEFTPDTPDYAQRPFH